MIVVSEKPKDAQEYDKPIIHFELYTEDEVRDYWRSKPSSVKMMHDMHPKAYKDFTEKYGQEFADEILALA